MRLSLTRNIPRIIIYLGLLALLLSLVVLSGNSSKSNRNGKSSPIKIQGTQIQNATDSETNSQGGEVSGTSSNNTSSTATRIKVSVNSNTTNGETTGSTEIEITSNGETQTFDDVLNKCLTAGNIKVSTEDSSFGK